jgi:hypothetical protein
MKVSNWRGAVEFRKRQIVAAGASDQPFPDCLKNQQDKYHRYEQSNSG